MAFRFVAALALAAGFSLPASAVAASVWREPTAIPADPNGVLRFPQAVAYDASGTRDPDASVPAGPYVYVADQHTFFIQKFTADGRFVRRFGGYGSEPGRFGATTASASPTTGTVGGIGGVAVDAHGRVFVLDLFNSRVERFTPGGELVGVFGQSGSAPGQLRPGINGGLAIIGSELYVADQNNHRLQRFSLDADGAPVGPPLVFAQPGSGPGQLDTPAGLGIDPAREHDVFVADDQNDRVQRFGAGGVFEALVGARGSGAGRFRNPYDAGVDLGGRLFVADNQNHRVVRLDAATLAYQRAFGGGPSDEPGKLANVRGIAVAPAADAGGGVFAANTSINQISEFGVDGAFLRAWGRDGRADGTFVQPRDVDVTPSGGIVVADTRADRVQLLHPDERAESWARFSNDIHRPVSGSAPGQFSDPTAVAVDPRNGDVYVAEGGQHRVQRLDRTGRPLTVWGGTEAGTDIGSFREPLGIAVADDGTVWVADTRNDRLQRRDPVSGEWSQLTGFRRPTAVAALPGGHLAVAELGADARADAAGVVGAGSASVIAADGAPIAVATGLDRPEGIAADGQGRVLVADTARDRIVQLRREGDQLVPVAELGGPGFAPGRFTRPMGMALFPDGDLVVADTYNNRLQRYQLTHEAATPATVSATVPSVLALTLPEATDLGAFTPGVTRSYDATLAADVVSTAGNAALTVSDPDPAAPGRLANGSFVLPHPLTAAASSAPPTSLGAAPLTLLTYSAPVTHAPVTIRLRQSIRATDALRTGRYAKSLTFTLSTTAP